MILGILKYYKLLLFRFISAPWSIMKNICPGMLIFLGLILTGCGSNTVIMKDYSGHNIYGKNLTIIKLFKTPAIKNPDDVIDDLGAGVPGDTYNKFFKSKFTACHS